MFENLEHDIKLLIQDFEAGSLGKDDFIDELKSTLRDHKKEAQEKAQMQNDQEQQGL